MFNLCPPIISTIKNIYDTFTYLTWINIDHCKTSGRRWVFPFLIGDVGWIVYICFDVFTKQPLGSGILVIMLSLYNVLTVSISNPSSYDCSRSCSCVRGRVPSLASLHPSGQRHKLAIVCLAVCFSKPLILRPNSSVSSINAHGSNFLDTDYTWI